MVRARHELKKAHEENYAIGHFNICNLETFQAVLRASNETNEPVFMGTSNHTIKYMGLENINNLRRRLDGTRVIMHLDHGSYENAKKCLRKDYHSIMFDGSHLPLEENIKKTRKLVKRAHKQNVLVEGEVGTLTKKGLTKVEDAVKFNKETNVDLLAVCLGNMHGFYEESEGIIDFHRLKEISKRIDTPLVLHGGSGLSDNTIKLCLDYGVNKVNIDSSLRWSFTLAVRKFLQENSMNRFNKDSFDIRNYLSKGREGFKHKVIEKIKLLHS